MTSEKGYFSFHSKFVLVPAKKAAYINIVTFLKHSSTHELDDVLLGNLKVVHLKLAIFQTLINLLFPNSTSSIKSVYEFSRNFIVQKKYVSWTHLFS
jgi:hypothetical protein